MISVKRHIRLKEFCANIEKLHIPTEKYLNNSPQLNRKQVYYQRTDNNGFIETNFKFNSKKNVVIIGDSFIENIFVDESKRISSVIERYFLESNLRVKVWNAGVSGSTGLGLLNVILNKIVFIKPDLIIFCQPSCDFSALLYENGYYNNSKYFANICPQRDEEKVRYDTISENAYQIYNNIKLLSTACELYRIELCISTCCSISSKRQLKIMNDVIRDNKYICNYDTIDLDISIPKTADFFYDKQHLNERGSSLVGKLYFEYINNKLKYTEEDQCKFEETNLLFPNNIINGKLNSSRKIKMNINSESSLCAKIKNNISSDINILVFCRANNIDNEIKKIKIPANLEVEVSIKLLSNNEYLIISFVALEDNANAEIIYCKISSIY